METNKQRIIAAVWADPAPAFGGSWKQSRDSWDYMNGGPWKQRGAVRLLRSRNGEGITVFFNHGSDRAGAITDVFDYFADANGTANFADTLRKLAGRYGLTLEMTEREREQLRRADLLRDVSASLIEHLRTHPDGPAGRYLTQQRGFVPDGVHFGQLTADSLNAAKDSLKQRGKGWDAADFEALGLTEARARAGYNLVLPYYHNGAIAGLIYRNVNTTPPTAKYLYSEGLSRGGYCDRLAPGLPAVIVEGQLDALRLMQQGVRNVIAIGGAKPGEPIARLLSGRGITEAVYIPDHETDEKGRRKTELVADAIRALQSVQVEGEPVLKSLLVLDLPAPGDWTNYAVYKADGTLKGYKIDADTFGKEHHDKLAGMLEFEPVEAWAWELAQLRTEAAEMEAQGHRLPVAFVEDKITELYRRNVSPFSRDRMRRAVGTCQDLARYGVTPQALADLDEWDKGRVYYNEIKAGAADLNKAVQEHADAGTIAGIVRRLADVQGSNTREEWDAQINEPFEAELDAIREQPETLKTKWQLFSMDKQDTAHPRERIEFYPADISVFCAATSHGKTAVLFEAALDLVRDTDKTYLFVSCEENKRQLLERGINVYLPIETTEDGKTANGGYCFIKGTRKRAIKAAIKDAPAPEAYAPIMGVSEHFKAIKNEILLGVEAYGRMIRPRLKFVHTEAAAETICNNILHFVEQSRAQGVDVGGVFVDYMQLLTTDARNYSRHDELKDICKALKDCAARTELPIIIAAQLNREVLRAQNGPGIDNITVANIGEGADIERIAHDIFLVWQTDKTPLQWYAGSKGDAEDAVAVLDASKIARGVRSRRLFRKTNRLGVADTYELKEGYLYVEQLKARDGVTGGWGLFPFDGERGTVGANDTAAMKKG